MACQKTSHTNKLILGAILGGVVAGTGAVLLNTKQGQKFKDDAADKLSDVKDQLQEFLSTLNDKSQTIRSDLSDRAEDYADRAQDFASQIREQIEAIGIDNKENLTALLIGAILGGMLGAGASSYMSSDTKNKKDMFKGLSSSAISVKNTIKDILSTLEDHNPLHNHDGSKHPNSVKDILDFATSGVQLWNKFKSKR